MKTKIKIIIIAFSAVILSSCGIMRMDDDTKTGDQKPVRSLIIKELIDITAKSL